MKAVASICIGTAFLAASAAKAAPVTFTFNSGDKGLTSIQKIADGIELTISNFVSGPRSGADSDDIAVYCTLNFSPCYHPEVEPYPSYQMAFNKSIRLLNYNVLYTQAAEDSTTTYSQGALFSVQINPSDGGEGIVQFSNQFIAAANLPIQVTSADANSFGLLQIDQLTVEEIAAPAAVPGPLPLIGAATAFGMSRRLRSRIKMGV